MNVLHDQKVSGEELWNKANESKSKDFEPPAKLYELALQREVACLGNDQAKSKRSNKKLNISE